MDYRDVLRRIFADLRIAVALCTRVPLAPAEPVGDGELARASWGFPVAGLVVGLAGAVVYWLAWRTHVPPPAAAALTLAATILLTGAMHEDGLADAADGLGGGKTREQKLQIMRDSRIGTYGACALALSLMLRWSAIAAIEEPRLVAAALLAAHAAARATVPAFMRFVPPARAEGLSAGVGQPPPSSVAIALALGIACLIFCLGVHAAVLGVTTVLVVGLLLAWLARSQIGGQTGDVLGAMEQIGEAAVLLIAASVL